MGGAALASSQSRGKRTGLGGGGGGAGITGAEGAAGTGAVAAVVAEDALFEGDGRVT